MAALSALRVLFDGHFANLQQIAVAPENLLDTILFEGGHALLDGQFADFVPGQRAILGAAPNQHPPVCKAAFTGPSAP